MKKTLKKKYLDKIDKTDWEFIEADTQYCTHGFHRYSSKYIPQIPHNLIKIFSRPNERVLDIFVGSGTTLVEAEILGRHSYGLDLNPLAILISRVKTKNTSANFLQKQISLFLKKIGPKIYQARRGKNIKYSIPAFPYIGKWFQPQVLRELSIIKESINSVENKDIKEFLVCGFSAILRSVSNAKSDYGNLMIDKQRRPIIDTFERFTKQLNRMIDGQKEFNKKVNRKVKCRICFGDARNLKGIKDNSIDLIVTHPPYIAAVPYAEYQKLSLNWLKESFRDLFDESAISNLEPRNLDRTIIGGNRSKEDVVIRFMESMKLVFGEMRRVLKKNRFCCVVIGHPTVRGEVIPLNTKFAKIADDSGLNFIYQITRGKYRTTMGKMKKEYILVFRKRITA